MAEVPGTKSWLEQVSRILAVEAELVVVVGMMKEMGDQEGPKPSVFFRTGGCDPADGLEDTDFAGTQ